MGENGPEITMASDGSQTCTSDIPHDVKFAQCASWCGAREAHTHCPWCKCRACAFCRDTSQINHVYASAGESMLACAEGARVAYPPSAAGSEGEASLTQCKAACDGCGAMGGGAAGRHQAGGVPADQAKGGVHGKPWGPAGRIQGYRCAADPQDRSSARPRITPGRGLPGPQWVR